MNFYLTYIFQTPDYLSANVIEHEGLIIDPLDSSKQAERQQIVQKASKIAQSGKKNQYLNDKVVIFCTRSEFLLKIRTSKQNDETNSYPLVVYGRFPSYEDANEFSREIIQDIRRFLDNPSVHRDLDPDVNDLLETVITEIFEKKKKALVISQTMILLLSLITLLILLVATIQVGSNIILKILFATSLAVFCAQAIHLIKLIKMIPIHGLIIKGDK